MALTSSRLKCATVGCDDYLRLESLTGWVAFGFENIHPALVAAGVYLGWRENVETHEIHCPYHVHAMYLVCARCLARDCFCMGGPRFEARPGDPEDEE